MTHEPSDELSGAARWSKRAQARLAAAVILMGVLLVLGFVVIVITIALRLSA